MVRTSILSRNHPNVCSILSHRTVPCKPVGQADLSGPQIHSWQTTLLMPASRQAMTKDRHSGMTVPSTGSASVAVNTPSMNSPIVMTDTPDTPTRVGMSLSQLSDIRSLCLCCRGSPWRQGTPASRVRPLGLLAYACGVRVLVVDGANVVGSRPTGWWHDRAGAAARLHRSIAAVDLGYDMLVLVLEGVAKQGQPTGEQGGIHTVHAPGSGDDAIVEQVRTHSRQGDEVVVVTADRALRQRVSAAGGSSVGPSWLLGRTS